MKWTLKALSDSDFASDKETRISVFGYIIYFCGIPIACNRISPKSQILVSCSHMTCSLYNVHYISIYIFYLLFIIEDKFKYSKIIAIQQVHQKIYTKQV